MKKIAEISKGNINIKKVTAKSWIVAKNHKILERL